MKLSHRQGGNVSNPVPDEGVASQVDMTELPLFPLKNVVLFPGMMLPLHIFEMRYREMISECVEEKRQFGVVLIDEGREVGSSALPHMVGTAAGIKRVDKLEDGRMNIHTVGRQRFRVFELNQKRNFLQGMVKPFPIVNGSTARAAELAHQVRPRVVEYIELLSAASGQTLRLDRLPEDPTQLALMVAIALQINAEDKQVLLEKAGVPEMLAYELHLLSRECLFTRHMVETQSDVLTLNQGPTGYIFPN
ncbi:MAG: LON peptidase substrate-binding domain-containing protein [Caldilineaceae bacterium]